MQNKLKRQGIEPTAEELFTNDYEDYESETEEWLDDEEDEEDFDPEDEYPPTDEPNMFDEIV